MSADWAEMELGDFLELKRGYDLPKKNRVPGKIPLVSSSGESDSHSIAKVKGPGVITGRYGTIGQVFYIEEDFWPLNTTLYVKDFKGNDPLFVYYFLKTIRYCDYSDKAAVPGINRNHIHKAEIRVPIDPAYQRDLAEKLSALDSKIQLNTQTNQTLEAIAQAIFKSWFVDFDPVKAKITVLEAGGSAEEAELAAMSVISSLSLEALAELKQSNPDRDAHDCMDAGGRAAQGAAAEGSANVAGGRLPGATYQQLAQTAALFPSKMQESELGDIPEGWEVKYLDYFIGFRNGKAIKKSVSGKYPVYGANGIIGYSDISRSTRSVIIGRVGAYCGSVLYSIGKFWASDNTIIASSPNSSMLPYIFYQLRFLNLNKYAGGAAQPLLNQASLKAIEVVFSSEEIIEQFNRFLMPFLVADTSNVTQNDLLGSIRDSLLPKLLSGEIELSSLNEKTSEANA